MRNFRNPYALLNYDMDNNKSTPEFEKLTQSIDNILDGLSTMPLRVNPLPLSLTKLDGHFTAICTGDRSVRIVRPVIHASMNSSAERLQNSRNLRRVPRPRALGWVTQIRMNVSRTVWTSV